MIKKILAHPLTRGLDIDDPETTTIRAEIIQNKPFLRKIYLDWYGELITEIPKEVEGHVIEIGSGGGFLKQVFSNIITTDIIFVPNLNVLLDAHRLPFSNGSLKAMLMTNVLHHLPNSESFLTEAERCICSGGVVVMIEPWVTTWSKLIYSNLHDEAFDPGREGWDFPSEGPLSGANGALPWMIFERDRKTFDKLFPSWIVQKIELQMPFRYLVSGGVSLRNLTPGWTFNIWKAFENMFQARMDKLGMFALIVLMRA